MIQSGDDDWIINFIPTCGRQAFGNKTINPIKASAVKQNLYYANTGSFLFGGDFPSPKKICLCILRVSVVRNLSWTRME
jgi:hypothetical protein